MKSIQEIFKGSFASARTAVVHKLRPDEHNMAAFHSNYTEHWPALSEPADVLVLSFGEDGDKIRKLSGGFITDIQPSPQYEKKIRIYVDGFEELGTHDLGAVGDGKFYGKGDGGGSRIKVRRTGTKPSTPSSSRSPTPEGQMEQRLIWVRKNHRNFRDPVWNYWEGKCAVRDHECNGLLVASHIFPWSRSTPKEKTDVNNGLLLSVPLDKLFDRGLISFAGDGAMHIKEALTSV